MYRRLTIAAGLALGLIACGGDSPTAPAPDPLCPFVLSATPIAGFPGLYHVAPEPAGPYTITINATSQTVEHGTLVVASSGDVLQGCRPCGCAPVVRLR